MEADGEENGNKVVAAADSGDESDAACGGSAHRPYTAVRSAAAALLAVPLGLLTPDAGAGDSAEAGAEVAVAVAVAVAVCNGRGGAPTMSPSAAA